MIINTAQQVHGQDEINSGRKALESGRWAEGEYSGLFKDALKEFLGVRFVELVNSGSSANLSAIMALTTEWIPEEKRLKQGDEVITTALCFPTTVSPIIQAGAVPVFVDVEQGTWNASPQQIESMITEKTKAIILAHNLGNPFNLDAIVDICKRYGIYLIEDNCDALSSEWRGQKTGSIGHIGTSSFYPAHHISTGEGGAVYTNDPRLDRALKSIINWGRHCWCAPAQDNTCGKRYDWQLGDLPKGYDHKNTYSEMGFNLKMTDIQASLGVEQMKRLSGFTEARKINHAFLKDLFSRWPEVFELPETYEGANPSWFGYVVKIKPYTINRNELVDALEANGIRSRAFFSGNITKQPVFTSGRFTYKKADDLSVTNDMMMNSFWIGVHPAIGELERTYMAETITNILTK